MTRVFLYLAAASMSGVSTVEAHHSNIAFDLSKVVAFEGTVTLFEWKNPHVYLRVENDEGMEWQVETDATPVMTRSGWTQESFTVGDPVTVRVNPHRDTGRTDGVLLSIQGSDGITLTSLNRVERSVDHDKAVSATSLAGIWYGDLLPASEKLRVPLLAAFAKHPLTEKGAAAKAAYDESMSPAAQCVAWPSPFLLGLTSLYVAEIELQENVIIFRSEFYSAERIIYMDGREHPEDGERTNQGHSIGWWDDDVLVVDTTLFAEHRSPYASSGIPSGVNKHAVERYALSEDRTQLLVDIFVEDSEYLAEPFTAKLVWNYSPHLKLLELGCDSDIARRFTN